MQIVPAESLLHILVYRSGTLAQAGHNHVIASHEVTGRVYLHEDIEKSAFELNIPVGTLAVDEAEARREEGAEFVADVPDSARQGTRKNLLSEAVLDGERHPVIRVVSATLKGSGARAAVGMYIGVKDQWRHLIAPVQLHVEEGQVIASGQVELLQSDLGLKPFSVLMGALQVRDEITVRFRIIAKS